MSETFERAVELLHAGRAVEGELLLAGAVEAEEKRGGWLSRMVKGVLGRDGADAPVSPAHAAALYELGQFLSACGDLERAIPCYRSAVALAPRDDAARRARLTYAMNLGEVLESAGRLDEAEQVLRANVEDRRAFYGEASEGLAWGLWPLASVLLGQGRWQDARKPAMDALLVLWRAGSAYVTDVLPLAGAIEARAGGPGPWVPMHDQLPDELKLRTVETALRRLGRVRDGWAARVTEEVIARCAALPGAEARIADAWAELAQRAHDAGAGEVAMSAARAYVELQDARGRQAEAIPGVQKRAQLLEEAGQLDEAGAAWAEAEERARKVNDPLALSAALRNRGLFLSDHGRDGWRALLEEAVAVAEAAGAPGNRRERALGAGALGIRVQHEGDLARAGELLSQAVELGAQVLHPADPSLFAFRTHREALQAGKTCGCSPEGTVEQKHATEEALLALARAGLPEGLLERVEVREGGDVEIRLGRAPRDDAEADLVQRAVRQALAQLRKGARA